MGKKDLTGQRFGRLTVIRENPSPYRSPAGVATRRWDCRCDCGTELTVLQNALTASKNGTTSCGCQRREKSREAALRMNDLTGKVFGRLTVLGPCNLEKPEANGNTLGWRCRCECGNEIAIPSRYLVHAGTLSCGCLLADTARKKVLEDNVNQRYDGTSITHIANRDTIQRNNLSGVRGVYWSNSHKCWIAKIQIRGKQITLGCRKNFDDAVALRKAAEVQYFDPVIEAYKEETKK